MRGAGGTFAGLAGLIGAGICLAAGLLLALAFPDESLLAIGGGSSLFEQTLAHAASFSQAEMIVEGFGVRTVPVLFVLIPILGVATGVAALAPRTGGMPARERLLWAAAAGLPFAILIAAFAVVAGEVVFLFERQVKFSFGMVLLLSSIWGCLGGALGMLFALRRSGEPVPVLLTSTAARFARIGWSALGPLLLALAVVGVLGTMAWVAQATRGALSVNPSASHWVTTGEQVAYAGDHAIAILPLGAGANERLESTPALPIESEDHSKLGDPGTGSGSSPSSNLFDYSDTMPDLLFALILIVLIGVPALLALYAGSTVVRQVGESRTDRAAAWGALVGPVWSLAMVLLTTLARKDVVGNPTGDSVFLAFLLGGAALGALGGLLAAKEHREGRPLAAAPGAASR
ncbi:MAG TPA: hypothetical protein VLI94_12240 [Solirubrobacterales bacterium]|nr:hypothetical protein [Solirubrobacterales bacterium]